jgi:hypothetical protein
MPNEKIAKMSGNPFVMHVKDSHIDHNTHATAGDHARGETVGEATIKKIRGF